MLLEKKSMQLKKLIDERYKSFEQLEGKVDRNDRDHFESMKKETSEMFTLNEEWLDEALQFVQKREVNVHPNQVASTHENIEMIILHSYYRDVHEKRFKELHQSAHYVLDMILHDLKKKESFH